VLEIDPNHAKARGKLAQALASQGNIERSIKQYRLALRLKPYWAEALNNLARILATGQNAQSHNPKQAIQLAQKASAD
jgi:Tfp pilus assembly protein PilF